MKRYKVVFTASAMEDIFRSYEWGRKEWGETLAQRWAKNLRESVDRVLKIFPLGQPLAPENEDIPLEIRQIIVGRYRVLFVIDDLTVTVIHVRGAFAGKIDDSEMDESKR